MLWYAEIKARDGRHVFSIAGNVDYNNDRPPGYEWAARHVRSVREQVAAFRARTRTPD